MLPKLVKSTVALLALTLAVTLAPAQATPSASNPLDDHGAWPIMRGRVEPVHAAWRDAPDGSTEKTLLGRIAKKSRVFWITNGSESASAIETTTRTKIADYFRTADDGGTSNPGGYAQLAVFGLYPKGESRRKEVFTVAMQNHYKAWVNGVARGIGNSKVIVILEPDLAVALTGYKPDIRFALAAYASRVLSKLPNVVIYLDGSSADWLTPERAVPMLVKSGIRNVRGIALGSTHYDGTAANVLYGATLVRRLAARGYPGKRVVIDTADNGRPFTHKQFYARFPRGAFDNPNVCKTRTETRCQTLGIPPTTATASTRWGMSLKVRNTAATYVDAFLWFGRPWLYKQASPFQKDQALQLARTTPWQ